MSLPSPTWRHLPPSLLLGAAWSQVHPRAKARPALAWGPERDVLTKAGHSDEPKPLIPGCHVAIAMDGNGRWAEARGLPRSLGHRAGAKALRAVVESAPALGVGTLSVYAFSADNWKRPEAEVGFLMDLLVQFLLGEARRLAKAGVRLSVVGRRDRLPQKVLDAIEVAEALTQEGRALHLRVAVDYSGREAVRRHLAGEADAVGPPVDLWLRTGGEQRLSDFLLWEAAYAELYFEAKAWPDFGPEDLARALAAFRQRDRRFGGLSEGAHHGA